MSTYLSGNSDFSSQIQATTFPNLFVVPAGPIAPNPAELIGSERMQIGLTLCPRGRCSCRSRKASA